MCYLCHLELNQPKYDSFLKAVKNASNALVLKGLMSHYDTVKISQFFSWIVFISNSAFVKILYLNSNLQFSRVLKSSSHDTGYMTFQLISGLKTWTTQHTLEILTIFFMNFFHMIFQMFCVDKYWITWHLFSWTFSTWV